LGLGSIFRRSALVRTRTAIALTAGLSGLFGFSGERPTAHANGDTRTLSLFHTHTKESATITFWRDGGYDPAGLRQLNWFLRDWRVDEPAKMDSQLFNILWEVYREARSREPIHIISAYRSPPTNAMLRHRSKGVSEHSQHMLGKAMDIRLPDVDTARLRAIAMRMQYGGVGFYPSSAFVHVDTGNVRAWPRMSEDQLARLFPDGKTVHLPSNGKPLAKYEEAKAEILSRNQVLASAGSAGSSLAGLFSSLFRRTPKPDEHADEAAAMVTASLPTEGENAFLAVPLPPRRPTHSAATPGAIPIPFARQQEYATAASTLLFSSAPLSTVSVGSELAAPTGVGRRYIPAEYFVAAIREPSLALRFSAPVDRNIGEGRFTGRALGPSRDTQYQHAFADRCCYGASNPGGLDRNGPWAAVARN
jgi:uncharacterized protein YcbK (DUF882 family)